MEGGAEMIRISSNNIHQEDISQPQPQIRDGSRDQIGDRSRDQEETVRLEPEWEHQSLQEQNQVRFKFT
jgi:hypothetical protein